MAIKDIIGRGIGFNPGSTKFIPTAGFTPGAYTKTVAFDAALALRTLKTVGLDAALAKRTVIKVGNLAAQSSFNGVASFAAGWAINNGPGSTGTLAKVSDSDFTVDSTQVGEVAAVQAAASWSCLTLESNVPYVLGKTYNLEFQVKWMSGLTSWMVGIMDGTTANKVLDFVNFTPMAAIQTFVIPFTPLSVGDDPKVYFIQPGSGAMSSTIRVGGVHVGIAGSAGANGQLNSAPPYEGTILTDTPAAYWRLGEGVGATVAVDRSGNGKHATYNGALTLGQPGIDSNEAGTAVKFTGDTQYVDCGDNFDFAGTTSFSVECWFKPDSIAPSGYKRLLSKEVTDGSGRQGWTLYHAQTSGVIGFDRFRDGVSDSVPTATAPAAGIWHHIVVTYDGADIRIYLNGVLSNTTASVRSMSDIAASLNIGRYSAGTQGLDGALQEVAVYTSVLTLTQVKSHFRAGQVSYKSAVLANRPTAYWRLNETDGTTMADSSGNGRDGTYVSSPVLGVNGALARDSDRAVRFGVPGTSPAGNGPASLNGLFGGSFSVEAWFNKTPLITGAYQRILQRGWVANGWILGYYDATVQFGLADSGSGQHQANATLAAWNAMLPGWHHAVGTYDGTNIKLYIDGVLVGTSSIVGWTPNTSATVVVGQGTQAYDLDEVALYDGVVLTQAQAQAHYYAGSYYHTDGEAGLTAWDAALGLRKNAYLNYCLHSGFEAGTVFLSYAATSVAVSNEQAHSGTQSLKVVVPAGVYAGGGRGTYMPYTSGMRVDPGDYASGSVWIYSLSAVTLTLGIEYTNAWGVYVTGYYPTVSHTGSGWEQFSIIGTVVPYGSYWASFMGIRTLDGVARTIYMDEVMFVRGSTVPAYVENGATYTEMSLDAALGTRTLQTVLLDTALGLRTLAGNQVSNPNLDTDLAGWDTNGGEVTIARTTANFYSAPASLRATYTAAAQRAPRYGLFNPPPPRLTVVPGQSYVATYKHFLVSGTPGNMNTLILWMDASFVYLSGSGSPTFVPTGAWGEATFAATAPANAAYAIVYCCSTDTTPRTCVVDIDNLRFNLIAADTSMALDTALGLRALKTVLLDAALGLRTSPTVSLDAELALRTIPTVGLDSALGLRTTAAVGFDTAPQTPTLLTTLFDAALGMRTLRTVQWDAVLAQRTLRTVSWDAAIGIVVPVYVPTDEEIAEALSGRRGPVVMRYRYEYRTLLYEFLEDITAAVESASVDLDNNRAIARTASFSIRPANLSAGFLADTDPHIAVACEVLVIGQWVRFDLGLFALDNISAQFSPNSNEVWAVDASDTSIYLYEAKISQPFSVAPGEMYTGVAEQLVQALGLRTNIAQSTLRTPTPLAWPGGTAVGEIVNRLMEFVNFFPVWSDPDGVITSRKRINPFEETAAVEYSTTTEPQMIRPGFSRGRDRGRYLNDLVLTIANPSSPGYALEVINADDDSAVSTVRKGSVTSETYQYGRVPFYSQYTLTITVVDDQWVGEDAITWELRDQQLGFGDQLATGTCTSGVPFTTDFIDDGTLAFGLNRRYLRVTNLDSLTSETLVNVILDASGVRAEMVDIGSYILRDAAIQAQTASLVTHPDPRRTNREFYTVTVETAEVSSHWRAESWHLELVTGAPMEHTIGLASQVDITVVDLL